MPQKRVGGLRVYVTFLKDDTIVIHPSNCTGPYYRMKDKGSIHLRKDTTAKELGEAVLAVRKQCKTE